MVGVQFAPNPSVVVIPARLEELRRAFRTFTYTGEYLPCEGVTDPTRWRSPKDKSRPLNTATPAAAMVLAFNRQATATGPAAVRAAVARDQQRVTGNAAANAALNDSMNNLAAQIGHAASNMLGPQTGAAVTQSLSSKPTSGDGKEPQEDGALTKGVKGVGKGFKRLFGGGDKKH